MSTSEKRTRGPNKQAPWQLADKPKSVLRLALDVSDPMHRRWLERMFSSAFSVRRALQHDARNRADAFWAAKNERSRDAKAARERLGLTKASFELAAKEHLDHAPHLQQFTTKALAMHLADSVWEATDRHLFRDASGRRHGRMHIGRWWDFRRLPGRAKSHTTEHKWETFRLHGSLAGHRAAYTDGTGNFIQPRLSRVESSSWWNHDGPLAVVFSLKARKDDLVLPVRLPTAPSNQACLNHYLADPSKWHKIDLVRQPDPNVVGGWRYEAHLMVLVEPYVSPRVAHRRATAAIDVANRRVGIDVNVSNITIASHDQGHDLNISRIVRDKTQRATERRRSRRERRRLRDLDRSRRANNRAQYHLSKRQEKRARRRAEAGLRLKDVIPAGPRKARTDGKPLQAYWRDHLSNAYRRQRRAAAADAVSASKAKCDYARQVAHDVVAKHGYAIAIEDCSISAWSRSWGRAVAAFSPAMLVNAIEREAAAVAQLAGSSRTSVLRVSTRTTAMSQHCPCGARVSKTLADRVHDCAACGLRADRDAVAAVLAAFVTFDDAMSARVDYEAMHVVLDEIHDGLSATIPNNGWQGTPSESNALTARDGSFVTWPGWTPDDVVVARRTGSASFSTPNEPVRTTSERERTRAQMSTYGPLDHLRDNP